MSSSQKTHCLNAAPVCSPVQRGRPHRARPAFLGDAKIRARHLNVDSCLSWAEMRRQEKRRENTREERERSARAVFEAICHRVNLVTGRVWASQALLARDAGVTDARVCRLLDDAIKAGFLRAFTLHEGKQRRNVLYVLDDFYLALGFSQDEIDGARHAAALREVDKAEQSGQLVAAARMRRAIEKQRAAAQKRQRVKKSTDDLKVDAKRELANLLLEVIQGNPNLSPRQAADEAERRLRQNLLRRV